MEALKCDQCGTYSEKTVGWYVIDIEEGHLITMKGDHWPMHLCSAKCARDFFENLTLSGT